MEQASEEDLQHLMIFFLAPFPLEFQGNSSRLVAKDLPILNVPAEKQLTVT
jgi:hypothetical protein